MLCLKVPKLDRQNPMDQGATDDSLTQDSNSGSRLDFHKGCSSFLVLLVIMSKDGVNVKSPGGPLAVHESAGLESHIGRRNHRGAIQSSGALPL
jgi:hypothetical protein